MTWLRARSREGGFSCRRPSAAIPETDSACGQSNYKFEGFRWPQTLVWKYNESTVSLSGLSVAASLSDIRTGNTNITMGVNNCGYSQVGFKAYGSFAGNTGKYANMTSGGQCLSPDGQNTVSWGPLSDGIASTCYWGDTGQFAEAD